VRSNHERKSLDRYMVAFWVSFLSCGVSFVGAWGIFSCTVLGSSAVVSGSVGGVRLAAAVAQSFLSASCPSFAVGFSGVACIAFATVCGARRFVAIPGASVVNSDLF